MMWIRVPRVIRLLVPAWLALCAASAPAQAAGGLVIEGGYVREMPPGQTVSAAFMRLRNDSDQPIAIVAGATDAAERAEIHTHKHGSDGMRMEKVLRLEIPAHGQQVFQPGGYHVMLIGLRHPLKAGETVGITLLDERGKSYRATLPVTRIEGATGAMGHHP